MLNLFVLIFYIFFLNILNTISNANHFLVELLVEMIDIFTETQILLNIM